MQKIGWIGVGIMGKAMVRNLMKAGYEVHIYARHPEKVADVTAEGAVLHGTIGDCVRASKVVITMVGFPQDVEEVYFTPGNILDSAAQGTILMDMTTTSPTLAQRIYREGTARGLRVLDAPVTGGDSGAKAGTLSILVGGDRADFDACLSIFRAMGTNITYFGPAGCGQHAKMANQIMIAGACVKPWPMPRRRAWTGTRFWELWPPAQQAVNSWISRAGRFWPAILLPASS